MVDISIVQSSKHSKKSIEITQATKKKDLNNINGGQNIVTICYMLSPDKTK